MGFYTILLVAHTMIVLFLIVMVLIQRTESDGLSGLGGGGGNQFMTGRGAANFMTRTTAILAAVFMVTSLTLAVVAGRMTKSSIIDSVSDSVPVESSATTPVEQTPVEAEKIPEKQAQPIVPKPE
ncbi:MAG: preprotein translocase subunit SecG [Pseudomonadota bacterium]